MRYVLRIHGWSIYTKYIIYTYHDIHTCRYVSLQRYGEWRGKDSEEVAEVLINCGSSGACGIMIFAPGRPDEPSLESADTCRSLLKLHVYNHSVMNKSLSFVLIS